MALNHQDQEFFYNVLQTEDVEIRFTDKTFYQWSYDNYKDDIKNNLSFGLE